MMSVLHRSRIKLAISSNFEPTNSTKIEKMQIARVGSFYDERYGTFEMTEAMFQQMVKNFSEGVRGIVPALDYKHASEDIAAGWFKELYIQKDSNGLAELWAEIEITPRCQKVLADKEYGYLSIDMDTDYQDNETLQKFGCVLLGAGLTNRPVIKKMAPAIQLSEEDKAVSAKIQKLIGEGYDQDQAVAIALDLQRKGKLNEGVNMDPKAMADMQKKCSDMEAAQAADKKKLADAGVENLDALIKMIADMKAQLEALKAQGGGAAAPSEDESQMGEMKQQLAEMQKKLELSEKDKEVTKKEKEFEKLMLTGKACAAQKESFMKGDMIKFAELAQKVKLGEEGTSEEGEGSESKDVQDEINEKAVALAKEKKIKFSEAVSLVLSENPELKKKREQIFKGA